MQDRCKTWWNHLSLIKLIREIDWFAHRMMFVLHSLMMFRYTEDKLYTCIQKAMEGNTSPDQQNFEQRVNNTSEQQEKHENSG